MKNVRAMKHAINTALWILCFIGAPVFNLMAQETPRDIPTDKPVKNTFQSIWIFDNPSVVVPIAGTFEWDMQHRFGSIKNGTEDLFGLYAPFANIRLGFEYVPVKNLMVGFGITRTYLTWDLNAKYALLHQTQSGSTPISLTYYVNAAIDTRDKKLFTDPEQLVFADRVSYFHQLLIARKFSDRLSVQLAGSLSHFNTVEAREDDQGQIIDQFKNDHLAVALSAKYNVTPAMNILVNFDQPITSHEVFDPQASLAFGVEFNTSSHAFQFFVGNFSNILPQRNNVFNTNRISQGEFLLGFNITRLWNF